MRRLVKGWVLLQLAQVVSWGSLSVAAASAGWSASSARRLPRPPPARRARRLLPGQQPREALLAQPSLASNAVRLSNLSLW